MKLPATKYLRIYSDIHLDFDIHPKRFKFDMLWTPEQLPTDKETTLILPGDLWHADKPFAYFGQSWLKNLSTKFQYILITLGNHDFWGGNLTSVYQKFNERLKEQKIDNIFLLQNSMIEIGNHKFIGATLWTDFMRDNECMSHAMNIMQDYKYIRAGNSYSKLRPQTLFKEHIESASYIFNNAKKDNDTQKLWIITHHLPSYKSLGEYAQTDSKQAIFENALYASNLDEKILASDIDYWIHGHSHHAQDYMLGKTRIISNPRGYPGEESEYNPWHLITLD